MTALPYSLDYTQQHLSLPDNITSTNITLSPVNGSSFAAGSVIQFDWLNRGFIDPTTIFIRYKYTLAAAAVSAQMIGTPVYTPFVRMETLIGSTVVESQNQYNQNCHLLVNLTTDVAAKYGLQAIYGYDSAGANASLANMDGRLMSTATETGSFSGLLPGLLSNCEKMIPAFAMSSIRTQLTMDSVLNMFNQTAVAVTGFTLTNVELCYTMVDAGPAVEAMVRSLGTFYIKSQSIANSSVTLANGTSGSISLVYNQRLASVKSAFVLFTGTAAASVNKWADFYDPTSSNGELSIQVGGIQYPQRPLSTLNNKNGILQALRNATGSLYDRNNTLSINSLEWNYAGATATTIQEPAKMIFGINLEKIHTPALLTGISTQNSAITVLLSSGSATLQAHTVNLVLAFDALLEIDTVTRMASVKQ